MTFGDWLREAETRVRNDGIAGVRESAYELNLGLWRRLSTFHTYDPVHIYDQSWDVLVVLDACRYDLMQEIANEYNFLSGLRAIDSPAACTPEWMKSNFVEEFGDRMAETAHVTANMWSEDHLAEGDFLVLDEIWKSAWDEDLKTVPPGPVTDAAIYHHRQRNPERMVVHYIQPHYPFVSNPLSYGDRRGNGTWVKVWDRLRRGEVSREEVWTAYRKNLRIGLDAVETLLSNIDAETVVVTTDHGNLVGERGIYGHPDGVDLPPSRRIPWAETSAENVEDRGVDVARDEASVDRKEKLEYLGYR